MPGLRPLYEATVHCPHCTAMESVMFEGRQLVKTPHWLSYRGRVYHTPCRCAASILDHMAYRTNLG